VVFTGNQIDPLPFYQHVFDVNVLASRSDAFPLSLLEASLAVCQTLPPLLTDSEAVTDQVTGSLFAAGTTGCLLRRCFPCYRRPSCGERSVRPGAAGSKGVFNGALLSIHRTDHR